MVIRTTDRRISEYQGIRQKKNRKAENQVR